jgi:hypothetical protein
MHDALRDRNDRSILDFELAFGTKDLFPFSNQKANRRRSTICKSRAGSRESGAKSNSHRWHVIRQLQRRETVRLVRQFRSEQFQRIPDRVLKAA